VSDIHQRKREHIELCNTGDVQAADHGGLFGEVALVHDAMPELSMDEVDLSTRFLDHTLRAPLMITGMTGGPPEAGEINRGLARLCASLGLAFGVGSQRVITKDAASLATFQVREVAPDVVLLGNVGVMQARDMGPQRVAELVRAIGADYLAIHLNPAQELVQPGAEADSDFRKGYETIARMVDALPVPVIVKECGTGLAPWVVRKLHAAGVRGVDLSGSGGTSWVKVEALRATGRQHDLGLLFADWGIPTAAAVAMAADVPLMKIASGGVADGLTAAKAIALGADVAGFARPVLQAFLAGGADGARAFLDYVQGGLRMAVALTGCRRPGDLRRAPRILGPRLQAWIDQSRRFDR
jgi:isopentenyl-diphosphate delta-isomerase